MSSSSMEDYWGIGSSLVNENNTGEWELAQETPPPAGSVAAEADPIPQAATSLRSVPTAQKNVVPDAIPTIPKGLSSRSAASSAGHKTTGIPSAAKSKRLSADAGGTSAAEHSFTDIRAVIQDAHQDDKSESSLEPKRIRSILKNRDPNSTDIVRTHSENRVGFKRNLVRYSDNTIALWSIFKFVVHSAVESCPFWHSGWFESPWGSQPILELQIPSFSPKETACFLLMFTFAAVIPLATIQIPIPAATSLVISEHPGFSLGMMLLLGCASGIYSLFYFEQFFGNLLPKRALFMALAGPIGSLYHIAISLILGQMVPYGPDVVVLLEVLTAAAVFGLAMPKEVRSKPGFCCRLASGSFVLAVSLTSIRLLGLMEAAKTRGAQVAYLLVLMLPVIFTRLTTDIQEAMPYASAAFSLIAQSLLTWIFSSVTYSLILHLAVAVEYYKLFLTYFITDTICLCGVGPIWSLWSSKGFLSVSKYSNTIFGWAQNPIKPKPVLLKNFTRMMAALFSPLLLTVLYKSGNQAAFKSVTDSTFENGQMQQMWCAMLIEILAAMGWMVLVYRLMKKRCEKDIFNEVVTAVSKYLSYILAGGTVVSMLSILISALPANGGFLD